jgi:hypothetical protein
MASDPAHDSSSFPDEMGGVLRQALIAGYGPQAGSAAAAAVFSWFASHPDRIGSMTNPVGSLYRMGRRRSRRTGRRSWQLPEVPEAAAPWIEPAVPQILLGLPPEQRVAVLLHYGYERSRSEVAAILGVDGSTVMRVVEEGLAGVRSDIEEEAGGHERTVHDQIASYAEVLDKAAPPLDELMSGPNRRGPRRIRWRAGPVLTKSLVGVLVIGGVLLVRSGRSTITIDSTSTSVTLPAVDVELVNRSAITPAMFSNWRHQFAGPGAITVVDGTYHMLSAAYGDDVATVAYATSEDGVVWSQGADRPLLDLGEAPWAPLEIEQALPRSVIVDVDGNWQLFFDIVWFDRGTDQLKSSIGRAVARDPVGTWVFDSQPVISRNSAYPWMADRVASPSVIGFDGGFVMLFVGEGDGGGVVGLAQSRDGAVWQLRPGPVYAASGRWDGDVVSQVDLVAVPGGMAMFYAGEVPSRLGMALSVNGLEWAPHPNNPLVTPGHASATSIFESAFLYDGATMLAYVETGEVRDEHEVAALRLNLDVAHLIAPLLGG